MAIKPITAQHHLSQIIKSKVGIDPSLVKEPVTQETQSNTFTKNLQNSKIENKSLKTLFIKNNTNDIVKKAFSYGC